MTSKNQVKIRITTKGENETVWATHIDNNHYRIDNSPFFAYGISWEDIVEALPDKTGFLTFRKIVKKSGNRTIRVADTENNLPNDLFKDIERLGCSLEGANHKYICINIPSKIELEKAIDYLNLNGYRWEHADPTYEEYN